MTAAKTILSQLGGNAFIAMTGARDFLAGESASIRFRLPQRISPKGVVLVVVDLDPIDTYTLSLYNGGARLLSRVSDIHAAELRQAFEANTGLRTRL